MSYRVNEIFYSLQGEGARAGEPSVFVRFTGCNLTCKVETHGFDCDTEFMSGRRMEREEILQAARELGGGCRWVVFTGGEPLLQLDLHLARCFVEAGWRIAVETNGTIAVSQELATCISWLVCSPKVAEHAVAIDTCDELRYVRHKGQSVPRPKAKAAKLYLSPAWSPGVGFAENVAWCIELAKDNPPWSVSMQLHKVWSVR